MGRIQMSTSKNSDAYVSSSINENKRDSTWKMDANAVRQVSKHTYSSDLSQVLGVNVSRRTIIPYHVVGGNDLFCNRELNMRQIDAVGFDMDWTLAQYNVEFDLLAYNGAKEKLVNWLGYPKEVLSLPYDLSYCRRGCLIDKKRGNIIKLDRHKYVRVATHGSSRIEDTLRKSIYRNITAPTDFSSSNFVNVDTPFSLVDGCLFAQLVDLFDKGMAIGLEGYTKTYEQLWEDLRKCVDRCHKDGVIKLTVAQAPEKYIIYDPNIFPMLESFRKAGKKVFLLTNSLWDYTNVVMNYLESRRSGSQKVTKWTEYFDLIITGGNKPAFLTDEGSLALYRVNHTTEALSHVDHIPTDGAGAREFLERGKIFQGGNAHMLHKIIQASSGDRILYVGDHVYSDVLATKKKVAWRTCLIIPELGAEITALKKSRRINDVLQKLLREQFVIENELDEFESKLSDVEQNTIDDRKTRLVELKSLIRQEQTKISALFHPLFGSLFKAGQQSSRFARQMVVYACMYTSRASNLGNASPEKLYRPRRDMLPHDVDQMVYQKSEKSDL